MRFSFSIGTNGCRFGVSNGPQRTVYTPPAQVHQPAGAPPSDGLSISLNDLPSLASSNPSLNNAQTILGETINTTAITKELKTAVSGVDLASTTPKLQPISAAATPLTQNNQVKEETPKALQTTNYNNADNNNPSNSSGATNSPLTLTETTDCNPNKIKNAIQNAFIGATKGASTGWAGAAAGAASAAIISFVDDADVIRSCKKQKLHESYKDNPEVNKSINKTINKAIGAATVAVVSSGNVISAVNTSINKAATHIVSTATSTATEFVVSDGNKDNNPDCSLNKAVIFSNALGGAAGNYAATLLVPVPCSTTTAVALGGLGGAVGGYLDAKKEQDACKNKKSFSPQP